MKELKKLVRNEDGSVMVIIVLMMVVLLGAAAMVIDVGLIYFNQEKLQNAADAAALAGAQDLPNASCAELTAINYAEANGFQESDTVSIDANTPYNGNTKQLEVICTETVPYTFARVFGLNEAQVSARAVAQNNCLWAGEALPFINLDDDYGEDAEIVAWEKVAPGDFESINDDDYEIINPDDPDKIYFQVNYMDGVELKEGTFAPIKQEVGYVYDQHYPDESVYVLSLSRDVINSGMVKLIDGSYRSLSNLKNNDIVHPDQLVLLECIFHDYDYKGKTLFLTVLDVYDIMNDEFPPDYVGPDGGSAILIE